MDRRMDRRTVAKGAGAVASAAALGLFQVERRGKRSAADDSGGTEPVRPAGRLLRDRLGRQPLQRRDHQESNAQEEPRAQGVEQDAGGSAAAGTKFGRTLWIAAAAGGPFVYTGLPLNEAHAEFNLTADEFAEVGAEIVRALDFYEVPEREQQELMAAYRASMSDVVTE